MNTQKVTEKRSYGIVGSAGEFLVASELARRSVIATLTHKNTPLIDIIATSTRTGRSANIQVKTRSSSRYPWKLNAKSDAPTKIKNMYYVFVGLKELTEQAEFYVVPYNKFALYSHGLQSKWLKKSDRNGKLHVDNNIRNFDPRTRDSKFAKKYLNKWNLLKL